ncbi:uncharacterized protein LOC129588712 [Paramacrobiotus metropolitanus]|uniref:uncharacterized protein LOC129588712 n=1 Tax=Paramacrobiotus metropolitanus TaxID=2943436 RepID=UPI002445C954|nr:uncharacterized protein LOC129588712 [Paramacrobiotus metropolitanus]
MAWIAPVVVGIGGALLSLFGGGRRRSEPAVDVTAIHRQYEEERQNRERQYERERQAQHTAFTKQVVDMQTKAAAEHQKSSQEFMRQMQQNAEQHRAEMQRRDAEYKQQQQRDNERFERNMQDQRDKSAAERQEMREEFRREQDRMEVARQADNQQREEEFEQKRQEDRMENERRMDDLRATNAAERLRMEDEFNRRQTEIERQHAEDQRRYETRLEELTQSLRDAEENVRALREQLEKPVKDRQEKLDFVNSLHRRIHVNNSLLLLGPKGTGKSTFMWLLNRGAMPKRTIRDGTVEMEQLTGYVDSIGLRGWTVEEVLKLMVVLLYQGFPKDLIIFGNDRIELPVTTLGLLGIGNPMIVVLSGDFWKMYQPAGGGRPKFQLVQNKDGVRRVEPETDLDHVYDLTAYKEIEEMHLGTPITHHDDIDQLVRRREQVGVRPFQFFMDKLRSVFTAEMENDPIIEVLFRFIYIYEKKYCKNNLKFMNTATLQDFSILRMVVTTGGVA